MRNRWQFIMDLYTLNHNSNIMWWLERILPEDKHCHCISIKLYLSFILLNNLTKKSIHEFTLTYNKLSKGLCVFGVLSEERAPSSVIIPEPGVLHPTGERGPSSPFSPDPESSPPSAPPCAGVETG